MSSLKQLLSEQRESEHLKTQVASQRDYLESVNPALLSEEVPPNAAAPVNAAEETAVVTTTAAEDAEGAKEIALYRPPESRLHVRDALELALSVLRRNAECNGSLSDEDYVLLGEISEYATASKVAEAQAALNQPKEEEEGVPTGLKPVEIQGNDTQAEERNTMDHTEFVTVRNAAGLPSLQVDVPTSIGAGKRQARKTSGASGSGSTAAAPVAGSGPVGLSTSDAMAVANTSGFGKPTLRAKPISQNLWVRDEATPACQAQECQQPFTLFNRKHHCRICGHIFCGSCSSNVVPSVDGSSARVCQSCFYDHQLVIPRLVNGVRRKRSRGVLKQIQLSLIVEMATYLPIEDIHSLSLVSADMYFAARDNAVWVLILARRGWEPRGAIAAANARFNFTEFLNYVQRITHEQCAGIASFASGLREVLSSSVKLATVGPSGIGKSAFLKRYCGEHGFDAAAGASAAGAAHVSPERAAATTMGLAQLRKRVLLSGALQTETTLTIYDTAGDDRYRWLRGLVGASSHVVLLCYDAHSKVSLVKAALLMEDVEPQLSQQPVVVCGFVRDRHAPIEVNEADAAAATVRCAASLQIDVNRDPSPLFRKAVQVVIDRIAAVNVYVPMPTILDVLT